MFCIIAFDIVDDKVRYRVVKELKRASYRVQKSVFESADMKERLFLDLKKRIENLINMNEDTVRYYFVCKECVDRIEVSGFGEVTEREDYKVI